MAQLQEQEQQKFELRLSRVKADAEDEIKQNFEAKVNDLITTLTAKETIITQREESLRQLSSEKSEIEKKSIAQEAEIIQLNETVAQKEKDVSEARNKVEEITSLLNCEEILAMTKAVEQEFKPVRAALKRAKRSIAWEFRKWPESKKEMAKVLLQRCSENENIGIKQLVAEKQQQVRTLLAADKRHKQVKITVSCVPGKKILFDILLEYGVHSKTIPLRVSSQATPEQVAEKCVISARGALKSPCRVDFTLPDDLIGELRKVEPRYVCGDDLTNALSRHIVELRTEPLSRKTEAENNMNN